MFLTYRRRRSRPPPRRSRRRRRRRQPRSVSAEVSIIRDEASLLTARFYYRSIDSSVGRACNLNLTLLRE